MKTLTNLLDRLPIDNKLAAAVATTALARLATYLGLVTTDPEVESAIALVAGAVAGYLVPNEGSVFRRAELEDGEPVLPSYQSTDDGLSEDVPPGGEDLV